MSQKLEKLYLSDSRSERKYVVSVLELFFCSNQFAISLAWFQQVHYCYCKAIMFAPAINSSKKQFQQRYRIHAKLCKGTLKSYTVINRLLWLMMQRRGM